MSHGHAQSGVLARRRLYGLVISTSGLEDARWGDRALPPVCDWAWRLAQYSQQQVDSLCVPLEEEVRSRYNSSAGVARIDCRESRFA